MDARDATPFAEVKTRLDEIVEAVSDESLSLDDALTLYEEAVSLGLKVSDLLESSITPSEEAQVADEGGENDAVAASDKTDEVDAGEGIA